VVVRGSVGAAECLCYALADPVAHERRVAEVGDDEAFELAAGLRDAGQDDQSARVVGEVEAVVAARRDEMAASGAQPFVDHVVVAGA